MALAKNAGIDLNVMFDAIRASAGNSFAWETVFPLVFNKQFDPEFAMELACKDMGLGYKLGKDLNVPLPLHSVVEQMMQQARLRYGNDSGTKFENYREFIIDCLILTAFLPYVGQSFAPQIR